MFIIETGVRLDIWSCDKWSHKIPCEASQPLISFSGLFRCECKYILFPPTMYGYYNVQNNCQIIEKYQNECHSNRFEWCSLSRPRYTVSYQALYTNRVPRHLYM